LERGVGTTAILCIYIRIIALNDLKLQKFYIINNDTYVDIANCFSSNLEEISMFEITTLIRQRMEIGQTPLRVNIDNGIIGKKQNSKLISLLFFTFKRAVMSTPNQDLHRQNSDRDNHNIHALYANKRWDNGSTGVYFLPQKCIV